MSSDFFGIEKAIFGYQLIGWTFSTVESFFGHLPFLALVLLPVTSLLAMRLPAARKPALFHAALALPCVVYLAVVYWGASVRIGFFVAFAGAALCSFGAIRELLALRAASIQRN